MGQLLAIFGFKVLHTIGFVVVGVMLATLGLAASITAIHMMLNTGGGVTGGGGVAGVPELDPSLISSAAVLLGGITLFFRDRTHRA